MAYKTVYEAPSVHDEEMLDHVLRTYHHKLLDYKVRVKLILTFKHDKEDIAIPSLTGYGKQPTVAKTRLLKPKEKFYHPVDVEITLDKVLWSELTEPVKESVLDHELSRVEFKRDKKTGDPVMDDLSNPILKIKPHDYVTWGIFGVVARHGKNSQEYAEVEKLHQSVLDSLRK
jgi:hypothetical protein